MGARRREELKEAKDADVSDLDLLSVMSATVNNLAIIKYMTTEVKKYIEILSYYYVLSFNML